MELKRKIMLLGIVVGCITLPVETAPGTSFNRFPFRLVLRSDLVPEGIERLFAIINIVTSGDVAKEFVGIRRQLCMYVHSEQT